MTTAQAIALYRAEKAAAKARGVDLETPKPVLFERYSSRHNAMALWGGHVHIRRDAFLVSRPRTG